MKKLISIIACFIALSVNAQPVKDTTKDRPTLKNGKAAKDGKTTKDEQAAEDLQPTKEIVYKIHKRQSMVETEWYSAVIRPIKPEKDDYKAYCRYIVKEIWEKSKTDKLVIVIYDDNIAYYTYEGLSSGHVLSKSQASFVYQHIIAVYDGKIDDPKKGESYQLNFYEEAEGDLKKYKEHETYKLD